LTEARGELVVTSMPDSSVVFLNGERVGVTPLKLDNLVPDGYHLRVEKAGFVLAGDSVQIEPGETAKREYVLREGPAYVSISSGEIVADVVFNTMVAGQTPLVTASAPTGKMQLTLRCQGCHTIKDTISLFPGDTFNKEYPVTYTQAWKDKLAADESERLSSLRFKMRVGSGIALLLGGAAAVFGNMMVQDEADNAESIKAEYDKDDTSIDFSEYKEEYQSAVDSSKFYEKVRLAGAIVGGLGLTGFAVSFAF
jgi:hypothetical protein